jgi:predicted transcriptional regulator
MTIHVSVPLQDDQKARLDEIAELRSETTADVLAEAVAQYLDYDAWFIAKVKVGLESAERGELVDFEEVFDRLERRMTDPQGDSKA